MIRISLFIALLLISISALLYRQDSPRSITARYTPDIIQVDGIMDEAAWETAETADNFWQFFPSDSLRAEGDTQINIVYNESTLYVGIRADIENNNYVVSSLRRDFGGSESNNIILMFDTFNNGSTAYMFGVTPYGVQQDVLISGGGS